MGTTLVLRATDAQRHLWGTAAISRMTTDHEDHEAQQSWAGLWSWLRLAACQPVPSGSFPCSYISVLMGVRAS